MCLDYQNSRTILSNLIHQINICFNRQSGLNFDGNVEKRQIEVFLMILGIIVPNGKFFY